MHHHTADSECKHWCRESQALLGNVEVSLCTSASAKDNISRSLLFGACSLAPECVVVAWWWPLSEGSLALCTFQVTAVTERVHPVSQHSHLRLWALPLPVICQRRCLLTPYTPVVTWHT